MNEIRVSANLGLNDSEGTDEFLNFVDTLFTIGTKRFVKGKVSVGTTEEAIPIGELTGLGWAAFRNLDPTNFVEIRTATAGTKIAKLLSDGGFALFYFGSGITAPFWIADTAACQCEFFILNQ